MEMTLRPYQLECVNKIDSLDPGSYLSVLATGLGKTVIFSHIKRPGRMLILSHREELVWQPKKYFDCSYGVEQSNHYSHGEDVVSASVQSLVKRLDSFKPDDFDIIITDEAHHAVAPVYERIYQHFKPRLHLGFTATANRSDHLMLGERFEDIIFERDTYWGIEHGYLSPIKSLRCDVGFDMNDYQGVDFEKYKRHFSNILNIPTRNQIIAEIYSKYAIGQTLIFASSVQHAYDLAAVIPGAVAVSGSTSNRSKIIQDFLDRKIKCLVNCNVFTEGTDLPSVETIIIAKPILSPSSYTQIVGRGLRLYPGKENLLLIDCVGATSRFGLCEKPHLFNTYEPEDVFPQKSDISTLTVEEETSTATDTPKYTYTYSLEETDIMRKIEEGVYQKEDVTWFLTVKQKSTHRIITKIIHTCDIDNAVRRIRGEGFSFMCMVSRRKALNYLDAMSRKDTSAIVMRRMSRVLQKLGSATVLDPVLFYQGLLAIADEGRFNDFLDDELIELYVNKSLENIA